ncbi:MAG: flagellar hook-basal body complex protein FliE [Bacteroidetes bacterium]|nr:flagellar hook-basal body complex protein FliE [Bacteroidota bacterium]MCL5025234.1 flagellar hook-basal body complex protein FliE [Chloroflexota bacterium]
MPINSIGGVGNSLPLPPLGQQAPAGEGSGESFQKLLGNAMSTLNRLQLEADSSAAKLAAGEPVELHEVLIATEKANIAFQLAVQVKNKVVEAYQEVMRMQV